MKRAIVLPLILFGMLFVSCSSDPVAPGARTAVMYATFDHAVHDTAGRHDTSTTAYFRAYRDPWSAFDCGVVTVEGVELARKDSASGYLYLNRPPRDVLPILPDGRWIHWLLTGSDSRSQLVDSARAPAEAIRLVGLEMGDTIRSLDGVELRWNPLGDPTNVVWYEVIQGRKSLRGTLVADDGSEQVTRGMLDSKGFQPGPITVAIHRTVTTERQHQWGGGSVTLEMEHSSVQYVSAVLE